MQKKILVAYASKYGSTAEIAEAIGDTIRKAGFQVDVLSVKAAGLVSNYDAVILGSAVYAGSWRDEAIKFMELYAAALSQRPLWLFSSGPTGEGDPLELLDGWRFPEAHQALADRIAPREIALFHGKIDPANLNFGERLIIKAVKGQVGDYRDWDAIRAWANSIAQALA